MIIIIIVLCIMPLQLLSDSIDMINMAVKETDIGTIMNHVSMSRHREQLSFIEKYIIYLLQLGVYNINSIIVAGLLP